MKNCMRRLISFVLAFALVLGLVPATTLVTFAEETDTSAIDVSEFAGKKVSILGDSISTYAGVSNNTSYNTTIGKNVVHYKATGLYDGVFQNDTWWQQAIDVLDMELCVNNSWSGSCILSTRAGTVGCYATRCEQLHNDHTGEEPDVIWVFMGTNDWSYFGDTWGSVEDVNYETLYTLEEDGSYTYAEPTTVYEAYAISLHKIQMNYPRADVYCMGLLPRNEKSYNIPQPTEANAAMKQMIEAFGFTYVDLESLITMTEDLADFKAFMGDNRVHPNKEGMDRMTQAIVSAMLGEEIAIQDITYSLTGVTASNDAHAVLDGGTYETKLIPDDGYEIAEITVMMDGEEITDFCYDDGEITISKVTGAVEITASVCVALPSEDYRWDYDSESNTLVSSTEDGYTENVLTKTSGSITDGTMSSYIGSLAEQITLYPNKEWVIEWKSSGDWEGMLLISGTTHSADGTMYLYRNAKKLLTIGIRSDSKYNNYGLDTSAMDMSGSHTFRLENRVSTDGSNMVYLVVDDIEIGAMNNYYVGSSLQGTSDWLNGQTLTFSYVGASGMAVKNLALEYLEIIGDSEEHRHAYTLESETEGTCSAEGYYTYICSCGETYTVSNGKTGTRHTYGTWNAVEGELRRECKDCGVYETKELKGYRWEMNEDGDGLISVTTDGNTENNLTVTSGSISGGTFKSVIGKLDNTVTLQPTDEWSIEWKSSGDWEGMLLISGTSHGADGAMYLYRNAKKLLTIGVRANSKYNNYGLDTSTLDMSGSHIFRLENRVFKDGSNMVYLLVNGIEIGAMDNYYVGSSLQGTSDWLNGQTLTFNYVGASGMTVKNLELEYLQIWENGPHIHAYSAEAEVESTCVTEGYTTYECSCGDSYNVGNGVLAGHSYGTWSEKDGELRRECKYCDAYEITALEGYRWEMNEGGDALVSVTTDGNTENALNQTSGSINGGALTNVIGSLEKTVTLLPTDEWVIEWRSSGDWSGMMLSTGTSSTSSGMYLYRNSAKLLTIGTYSGGTYHNYGVDTTALDMSEAHVFRLENRVNEDGSNMVYVMVDGTEIGAMNNHYDRSSYQGTSDWLNGKTLTFNYFGVNSFAVTNMSLEYLQIWTKGAEHQHSYVVTEKVETTCAAAGYTRYTCRCGDSYDVTDEAVKEHTYGLWRVVGNERRRFCVYCDAYESELLKGYRWEYSSANQAMASVTSDGNTRNKLTLKTGSIGEDGVFNSVVYQMSKPVTLYPNVEWVIEWEASGDWNGMLISSGTADSDGMNFLFRKATTDLLALGTKEGGDYHNYGIDTTELFDAEQVHTYRLENRVNEDGTNMVYLVVDDIEIGAMDNYHENTVNKSTKSDWLNGQELTFGYIGKTAGGHQLKNIKLNYLQIWMNGVDEHQHAYVAISATKGSCVEEIVCSYECSCGATYTGGTGKYGGHKFGAWLTYDTERRRECTLCGETQTVQLGTYATYDESVSDNYYTVISQKDYTLCDGVTESEIILNNSSASRRQVMHVVEVDVTNQNVEILPGYYGIDKDLTNPDNWSTATMEVMMDYYRDELGYNVVAGMNTALGYESNAPFTYLVYNGKLLAEPGSIYYDACSSYLAVMKNEDGTVYCELREKSEALHGDEWQAFTCNFGFVVENGELANTSVSHSGGSDRSMIGIKADGTLVIVQVQGENAALSTGLSQYEQGETMLALGCVWAVNGDGGGSSQILTKREGESDYTLRNIPSDGTARATIHGIIIASKAAADGVFDHASLIVENEYITPNGVANVEVKGVDGSGMPADLPEDITYAATGGSYANGVFTSDGTLGEQTITAYYNGQEVGTASVNVVIPTSIAFDNAAMAVPYGKTVEIPISAYYGAFEVALSGADIDFTLSANIGSVNGLTFTAPDETQASEINTADLTATLVYNTELTATIPVYVGKGSEALYDFEDQDLHGWYRSTRPSYNAIQAGGSTYIVDETTGQVHNGDYAMAVKVDFSNSLESLYQRPTLVAGETIVLHNAVRLGMWIYIPDEAVGLELKTKLATFADAEGTVINEEGVSGPFDITGAGETGSTFTGFNYVFDESGWHYISVDLTGSEYTGLLAGSSKIGFFISQQDGMNGYEYSDQKSVNGEFTFYIDDITVDYSNAVDDREAPEFGAMTYTVSGANTAVLNGDLVKDHTISFAAPVAEYTGNAYYTGIDISSGRVYIDGVDYTESLTWSEAGDEMILKDVALSSAMHTIKFSVSDYAGNYESIVRTIIVESVDSANVKVVPHTEVEYLLLGSLYYIDVVADDPETISSVTVTLDLNNISVWQLDHMDVANGFNATYTLDAVENIATVTITSTGSTSLSGEDQILVSIPIRTWELEPVEPKYERTEIWMYDDYKAANEILPMDLNVEIDAGYVVYKDGSDDHFTSPKIQVDTELRGTCTQSGSTMENNILNEEWYADWNGGHDHRPETKEYYDETSTNHVDAILLEDKAPTCTEDGYTGRTYCEVCQSVVDWGTTLPAGHSYELVDGVLKCTGCGELCNGTYEGAEYVDGIKLNGWVENSYYVEGVKLTGVQKVPSPTDDTVEYYYDFGEDGVCKNQMKYTGFFYDGEAYRYAYLGELTSGWQTIDSEWYYFCSDTMAAANGTVNVDGIDFEFEENGRLISGVWVVTHAGRRYCFGPGYYEDQWAEIDGEWYYFSGGYAKTGLSWVKKFGEGGIYGWADMGEDGAFQGYMNGFFYDEEGYLNYCIEGINLIGLHCIDGDYYFFNGYGHAVTGSYNCWETHCDLPCGTYEFGEDCKMLQGFVQKDDGLYYYVNGKPGTAGLTKIGEDYYFISSSGKLAVSCVYNCWATNCDLPTGNYEFGADGKMLQGLVQKDDGLYYYVNGKVGPAGLTKIGDDYYFVTSTGKVVVDCTYDCWATNCDLPVGTYTFGEDGKMLNPPVVGLMGDVNGDGNVDNLDATLVLQYAAGWDVELEVKLADVNGDGNVDNLDATLILQYAAGWDVEFAADIS